MNSQLYIAASGMIAESRRLDLIADNLANVATPGHRAERLFAVSYGRQVAGSAGAGSNVGVEVAGTYTVPLGGPLRQTGRELDVALERDAYLVVETDEGRGYIRGGSLQLSAAGELIDAAGRRVLDTRRKPIDGLGPTAALDAGGRVLDAGAERARLAVVRDPESVLRRRGDGALTAAGRDAALRDEESARLRPGWLEGSAVDAVGELVRLIESQRAFESYQKLISLTMNEVNRRAVNDLAG